MHEIKVQMFGEFTITSGGVSISDNDNRSKKLWLLLAYLIYNKHRVIKQKELIDLLWTEDEMGSNPVGALKTLFYRVRAELDALWDGAGKDLILAQNGGYIWNSEYTTTLDCEDFDELNKTVSERDDDSLEESVALLNLHRGEFLSKLSSELWVMPIATYYHNTYILNLLRVLPVLIETERYKEAVEFCKYASVSEPFHEGIHCYYMRAYMGLGKQQKAVDVYQKLSTRLLSELGIIPSDTTREIYHEAIKSSNDHTITVEALKDQLKEANSYPGALICEYDFFRVLCYSMSRSVMRSGIAVHLVLVTVKGKDGSNLDAQKREKIMANLEDSIRHSLRRGDSAARCSASQYVIMLPRANYENSCMVCERVLKAYYRDHSRLDADLRYEVFPIQPDEKENMQWMH